MTVIHQCGRCGKTMSYTSDGVAYCICWTPQAGTSEAAAKAAQVAAIRVRLGDIAAGANGEARSDWGCDNAYELFCSAVASAFTVDDIMGIEVNGADSFNLDYLAAWMWEQGVR